MRTQRFACGRGFVDVHTDDATLAELVELTSPFFETVDRTSDEVPSVWAAGRLPDGPSWERLSYSSDFEPDRVLWVDHERRAVAVLAEASSWRTQQVLRSIRNIARWQAYAEGELFVHGGLVALGGTGVAFLGHKRAGKTSSILSALVNAGAEFVSNDDLVLAMTGDGPLTGFGYPRTVNVRTDSLLALATARPELATLLGGVSHPANSYPGKQLEEIVGTTSDGKAIPESLWVRCAELAAVTGAVLRPRHLVHAVVFPQFVAAGEPIGVDVLDDGEAAAKLAKHVESKAVNFDPFLADWFEHDATGVRERTTEHLLRTARFIRVRQHLDHMAKATAALVDELRITTTIGDR